MMGIVFDTRRYGRMRVESVPSTEHQYLQDFENRGGIRIHMNRDGKYGTIEMAIKPTADQMKKLRSFINAVGGNVDIDFMDENYNTTHAVSYEGVSPTRALSGITTFYDKGIKPKGNVSYSLSTSNKSVAIYDKMNGTNVADFFDFLRNGKVFENGKPDLFYIARAGSLLRHYGIKGEFVVGRFTYSKEHTQNEDHNLGVKEWVDVINNINTPLAIASYRGLPNRYRIYTNAMINGKNICVGVNVSMKDNTIELSNIISAYGRDINLLFGNEVVNLLYPNSIEELKQKISQVSTGHNSLLNATSSASADKDTTSVPKNQISEEKYSLNRTDIDYLDAVGRGDMATAQKDVEKAAKDVGYTEKVYHGTNKFGFTTFKTHRPSGAIFTTTRRNVSANYAGDSSYASVRRINRGYKTPESVEDVINNARSVFNQDWRLATQEDKDIEIAKVEAEAEKILGKLGDLRVEMPEDIETTIVEVESIIHDGAYARDNEISKETIERDYELFQESRATLRDYNTDNLTDEQKAYRNFLLSYEYGDAAVDVGEGLAKAVDSGDYAIVNDSLISIERLAEITKETHNIGSYELMGNLGNNPLVIDAKGRAWYDLNFEGMRNTDDIAEWAKDNGYTSVVFKNIFDYGDRSNVKVFFDSNQLKSADAITYDNKGNIIPLSERFNAKNNDIRYSINRDDIATAEMDAEANKELTESQKAAKVIADEIEARIKKIAQSKELTFEQIELPSPIVGYRKQYLWGYMISTPLSDMKQTTLLYPYVSTWVSKTIPLYL